MTAGPSTNSTECDREKLVDALGDEALIKQVESCNLFERNLAKSP